VVCNTGSLRSKGKWQNPDVTQVTIEYYPRLRSRRVVVTTFEVKRYPDWDVACVYEAASQKRFAHESYVVLELPRDIPFDDAALHPLRVDQIVRECERFGVGLAVLQPHYKSYKLMQQIETVQVVPADEDVEKWLDYMFLRREKEAVLFEKFMDKGLPANGGS